MGSVSGRTAALLLAGTVLAAACGSSGDEVETGASSTTATTLAVPVTDETGAVVPPPGPVPAGEAPPSPGPGPGTVPPDPVPGPGDAPPPGPAEPTGQVGPVGALGPAYLRPDGPERVLVQVLVQEGAAPEAAVPERIRSVLMRLSGKSVSLATSAIPGGPRSWTGDELRALADRSSPAQSAQQAVLTLLYLRGGFAENERAVGVAVRGDVAAVFAERVTEAAGVFGDRRAVEDAVSMHEVGHLLGLVDLVVDTGRADPEHPGHSPNEGSVMYFAVESTLLGDVLTGGPPRDFDQDDLDELARIRNG